MLSKNYINKIMKKLNNNNFNMELINEITNCSMLMCFFNDSNNKTFDNNYDILIRDMIDSVIEMQDQHENILFTNPFSIFKLSWFARYLKDKELTNEERTFMNDIRDLTKSNIIIPNEFPIQMKSSLLVNVFSKEYVANHYHEWVNFMEENTCIVIKKDLFSTTEIIGDLLIYNHDFLENLNKNIVDKWAVYFMLKNDFFNIITLGTSFSSKEVRHCISLIDDKDLSISEYFGKGLILSNIDAGI